MTGRSPRMVGADWMLLVVLSVLWAGSFLFYRVLAAELPPLTAVFGRVGIGALAMAAIDGRLARALGWSTTS